MSAAQDTPCGVAGMSTVNSTDPWSPRAFKAARSSSDSAVWLATTSTFALSAIRSLLRLPRRLVRGVIRVPVPQRAERLPEVTLERLVVQRLVDVRHPEGVARGGQLLDLAGEGVELRAHRNAQAVQLLESLIAHDHHDSRLDHGQLVQHPRLAVHGGVVGVAHRALDEHRAVDRERVDAEPLEALHQSAAGAAVEGHALLDLRGHRRELEEEDVRLGMTRPQHRHQDAAGAEVTGL